MVIGVRSGTSPTPPSGRGSGAATVPRRSSSVRSVDAEAFARVLHGRHPVTGALLVSAQGSNGRAEHDPASWRRRRRQTLTVGDAAELVGVDASYIRRLATRTAAIRAEQDAAERSRMPGPDLPAAYLDGAKDVDGRWWFDRDEVERFAESRRPARVVLGYDVTWSAPKSVSMLYARGTEDRSADGRGVVRGGRSPPGWSTWRPRGSTSAAVAAGRGRRGWWRRRTGISRTGRSSLSFTSTS